MVFVNGQKFACESCIKGHRSSSCHHSERPLFEVKKKGRPVSQCEKCRELRKTKRVHSKCDCSSIKAAEPSMRQLSVKSKRFIPILPALPNGIKDAIPSSVSSVKVNSRGDVATLLNPCLCKDIWNCKCNAASRTASGLSTLADAAAMCCGGPSVNAVSPPDLSSVDAISASASPVESTSQKHPRDCCQASPKAHTKKLRRQSPTLTRKEIKGLSISRGPELPPIVGSSSTSELPIGPPPVFPDIPPLSSVASLAGSGCCCGFRCTCPGCVEHRGASHVAKDHSDCPDECGTCVDYEGGIELPLLRDSSTEPKSTNFIDAFFARAAASIPAPPSQRATVVNFDPTDITVYPPSLFSGKSKDWEERGVAFGLVRVPKLECCAGKCGCPDGSCGCGTSCDGCGGTHDETLENCCSESMPQLTSVPEPMLLVGSPPAPTSSKKGSCCG